MQKQSVPPNSPLGKVNKRKKECCSIPKGRSGTVIGNDSETSVVNGEPKAHLRYYLIHRGSFCSRTEFVKFTW